MAQEMQSISALSNALSEIGLSELERRLYLVSLSLGPAPMTTIAERMGISRPNVYKIIRGLEKHGLASFIGGKKYIKSFQVESPSVVMELLRAKREDLGKVDEALTGELSDLLAKYEQGRGPANVRVLRGRKEFRDVYVQVFEEAEGEIQFFGSFEDFIKEISPELGDLRIQRRVQRGISIRALGPRSAQGELFRAKDAKELRTTRFLVGGAPFVTSFYLFANKAVFWQPMTPVAILVEDQYLVSMWRVMFELLWDKSSE